MVLLDSHVAIWLAVTPERLSRAAKKAIAERESQASSLAISVMSLYEIARAIHRGRIEALTTLETFLRTLETVVVTKPLTDHIAVTAAQFPDTFPSDPFDRIIAATALVEGIPLITADERIRKSGVVQTIW